MLQFQSIDALIPYARNARTHSAEQVAQLAASIDEFGFAGAIVLRDGVIAKGHGSFAAIRKLYAAGKGVYPVPGKTGGATAYPVNSVPVQDATGWSEAQFRAFVIADNKLAQNAGWDNEILALEFLDLKELNFDVDLLGFADEELASIGGDFPSDLLDDQGSAGHGEKPEPDEATKAMLDSAWVIIAEDWAGHLDIAKTSGILSPNVTRGTAAWHFVQAKHLGADYPGVQSLAFCPERFWTGGADKLSVAQTIGNANKHAPSMRGIRWACDERPNFHTLLSHGMPIAGSRLPLDFPAKLAKSLMDEFCPQGGRVLDPCHGWGGRYAGFLLADKPREYVGCDPSPFANAGLIAARHTLAQFAESDKVASFVKFPFEDAPLDGLFDFALTSPPYFDVEGYAGDESSTARYDNFDVWVQGFYLPMLRKVAQHLKPDCVFALQVGSQTYPLAQTAIDNAAVCGFRLIEKRNAGMNNTLAATPDEKAEAVLILQKLAN